MSHVAVEILFGPEAAEEVLGQVQLGPLHVFVDEKSFLLMINLS